MGEAEKAVGLIPGKDVFQKILNDILAIDQTGNLQPDGKIVIPLLHQAVVRKGIAWQEWNELLKEAN